MTGAEPLSQAADKGWSNVSTGDKIGAVLAVAGVLPVGRIVGKVVEGAEAVKATTAIGKLSDLGHLRQGEQTLLDRLPNLGSPKANWAQNSSVLRGEIRKGVPIRDASVNAKGELLNNTGFLRAERDVLENKGWTYHPKSTMWHPPAQ
jgi:hypothetical protein